jgi:hypothetical protein
MHSRAEPLPEARRAADQRSVSQVLAAVVRNLEDIFISEVRLVQAETRAQLRNFRPAVVLIVIGVLGGLLSALFILLAVVAALNLIISLWLAALLVGLVMAVFCATSVRIGTNLVRNRPMRADAGAEVREKGRWTGRSTE